MKLQDTLPEAIKNWKTGIPIWSADLGGLGPGYEQCIQILLWEIVSRWTGGPFTNVPEKGPYPKPYTDHVDSITNELDPKLGFSGAQVGVAKQTAFQFLVYGYEYMMAKLPDDRWIQVVRDFPSLEKEQ
jgi:hypothetical protein